MLVFNGVFEKKPSQKIAIPVSPFLLDSYIRFVLGAGLENIVMFKQVIQAPTRTYINFLQESPIQWKFRCPEPRRDLFPTRIPSSHFPFVEALILGELKPRICDINTDKC